MNRKVLNIFILIGAGLLLIFTLLAPTTDTYYIHHETRLGPGQTYAAQEIYILDKGSDFDFYVNINPTNVNLIAYLLPGNIEIQDVLNYHNSIGGSLSYYDTDSGNEQIKLDLESLESAWVTLIILNYNTMNSNWNNITVDITWGGSYVMEKDITSMSTKYLTIGISAMMLIISLIGLITKENQPIKDNQVTTKFT